MDPLLVALIQATPELGVVGLLVTFIIILIRREGRVELAHGAQLDRQSRQHEAELARLNRDHDAELVELTGKIRGLRVDLDALDRQLSAERAARLGLPRRGVDSLDLDLGTCTVTLHYTDGTAEVREVTGCDGTTD